MDLYLIRHGQSANNVLSDPRAGRVADPPLTETGLRQAGLVADHLAAGVNRDPFWPFAPAETDRRGARGHGITLLYTSPMLRALQTAEAVGRALGLAPEVLVDAHEQGGVWSDHGEPEGIVGYPGITRAEILSRFPGFQMPDRITERGWWSGGLESGEAAAGRAAGVAEAMRLRTAENGRIAMVTHGAFSTLFLSAILGARPAGPVFFHLDNASVSLIRYRPDGEVSIRYLNRVEFLPPELITT